MADPKMSFTLENASILIEPLNIIQEFEPEMVTIKFSSSRIAVIFDTSLPSEYMVALNLVNAMFTDYSCSFSTDFFSTLEFRRIHTLLKDMIEQGFESFTVSITDLEWADFTFHSEEGSDDIRVLPIIPSTNEKDMCDYNVAQHIIISPDQFLDIISQFAEYDTVLITVMDGQVKFSHDQRFKIYHAMRNECKIGSMIGNNELSFSVSLNPKEAFIKLARSAQSIIFYKAIHSFNGVIEFRMNWPIDFLMYKPVSH